MRNFGGVRSWSEIVRRFELQEIIEGRGSGLGEQEVEELLNSWWNFLKTIGTEDEINVIQCHCFTILLDYFPSVFLAVYQVLVKVLETTTL